MEDIVYQIQRGGMELVLWDNAIEVPQIDESYFDNCFDCILSTVQLIFTEQRGEYSYDDIYNVLLSWSLLSYRKQENCVFIKSRMHFSKKCQNACPSI